MQLVGIQIYNLDIARIKTIQRNEILYLLSKENVFGYSNSKLVKNFTNSATPASALGNTTLLGTIDCCKDKVP